MATRKENDDKQTKPEFDVSKEIEELLHSMEGNFSEIEDESALSLVERWYDFLHSFKEPEVKELASGLKEL